MLNIRNLTQLQFMQSFQVDEKNQVHPAMRVPHHSEHKIISPEWVKHYSTSTKRFLMYMNKSILHFSFINNGEIIFQMEFQEMGTLENTLAIDFGE